MSAVGDIVEHFRCSHCGATNDTCVRKMRGADSKSCCSQCRATDTHNRPPSKLLSEMSQDELNALVQEIAEKGSAAVEPTDVRFVVDEAARILGDRSAKYDNDNLAVPTKMAQLLSAYFDKKFTVEDACMVMVLHKLARVWVDSDDVDHRVDAAAYLSMAWKARD